MIDRFNYKIDRLSLLLLAVLTEKGEQFSIMQFLEFHIGWDCYIIIIIIVIRIWLIDLVSEWVSEFHGVSTCLVLFYA